MDGLGLRPGRPALHPDRRPDTLAGERHFDLCRIPITVADLASDIGLPLGVVRVLLDDLARADLVEVKTSAPRGRVTGKHLLRQLLDGLHAL